MDTTKQKYIRLSPYNQIIIFPEVIEHKTFSYMNPVSAGFCYVEDGKVNCFGNSVSLNLSSNPDDTFYATRQIFGIEAALIYKKVKENKS